MREIFTRLLKVLWVFYILYTVVWVANAIIILALIPFIDSDIIDFGSAETNILGIAAFFLVIPVLMLMQYILLGNFNPKILFKRKSR